MTPKPRHALPAAVLAGALAVALAPAGARAEALLLVEADSGKVLKAQNATYPWYPASVTKLMTTYTTLRAVKEGRITLDTLFTVSPNAVAQQPVKMGFRTGTQLTVDNALKMMLVKSANDMAVVLAEGVSGSIEKFADEMNANAQRLGMTQTSYVNPNGLPADEQITSARDLAILARALIREFPEYDFYWHIPSIRLGKRVIHNYNALIDRYPGADGMKTGFICASGYNLVATATRDGRRLIAVVLGARNSAMRAQTAAELLETGFTSTSSLSWLMPSLGKVDNLAPINAAPPNLRDEMCGAHRKRPGKEETVEDEAAAAAGSEEAGEQHAFMLSSLKSSEAKPTVVLGPLVPSAPPIDVYVGPPRRLPAAGGTAIAAKPPKGDATAGEKDGKPGVAAIGVLPLQRKKPSPALAPGAHPKPAAAASKPATARATKPAGAAAAKPKPTVAGLKPAGAAAAEAAAPKPVAKPKPATDKGAGPKSTAQ